jgi:Protein of unknown function (DUF3108)
MMPKPTQAPQESGLQSQGRFAMVPAAGSIGNHGDESGVHGALNQRTIHLSYCGYILIFLLSLTSVTAFATDSPSPQTVASLKSESRPAALPFFVGEELLFEVRWMGFLAGNASMAVSGQVTRNGHDVYHIRSLAESSPFFSLFYNVCDMGETFVDVRELYPWYFRLDQREGSRVVQRTVTFDQRRGVAIYTKNQETPQEVKVPWGIQDSLSSFYLVRTLPLRVGQSIHLKTFSNGKTYDLEVQILRREKVEAYWGPVDALVVQPLMRFEEILRQKGEVLIWVTDDDRRLPIRMKTAIKVGSIEATLIDVKSTR